MNEMTPEEAERLWNLPKCERCEALESRLRAALVANESFVDGTKQRNARIHELERALIQALQGQKWIKG